MADYTRNQIARTTAAITAGEVASATLSLDQVHDAQVTVDIAFTIGPATDVTIRAYGSNDQSTWDLVYNGTGAAAALNLTASDTVAWVLPRLNGYKFMRVTQIGTSGGGYVATDLVMYYRWLRKGSQI